MRLRRWIGAALLGLVPGAGSGQDALPPLSSLRPGAETRPALQAPAVPMLAMVSPEPVTWDGAPPGPVAGWSLADVEQAALGANPSLSQAAARVEAARGRYLQVGLYPNPTAGYVGSEMGNEGRAGQQGGFVSQELVTAGKLRLNRDVVCWEIQQAEWAYQSQRLRVLTDVRRFFYEVLVAQKTVELTEQLVRIGQQGVKSSEQLLEAKEVARTDVLQARIEAQSARVLLQRAQNRYLAAWRNLAAVMGACHAPPAPLAGDPREGISDVTWEEALQRLWTQSPQLAAARAGVARAQAALQRECAGRVPNVEVQTGVQYDNSTGFAYANLQIGAPIPLFNRNQGNIHRAQAELLAAQYDVKRTELELQQRLAAAFEQYTNARVQADAYSRDILPNAQASLKLTTAGYQQGEFGYLALLTAQRTYFQANLTYLEALRDLRAASALIEGNLLSDSLRPDDAGESGARPGGELDARGP